MFRVPVEEAAKIGREGEADDGVFGSLGGVVVGAAFDTEGGGRLARFSDREEESSTWSGVDAARHWKRG